MIKSIVTISFICLLFVGIQLFSSANAFTKRESHIEIVSQSPQIEVSAYPNPFRDVVTLDIFAQNCRPTVLKIYDIIGVEKAVIELEDFSASGRYKVQIKDLDEGIYFCNIYSNSKLLESKKLVCSK